MSKESERVRARLLLEMEAEHKAQFGPDAVFQPSVDPEWESLRRSADIHAHHFRHHGSGIALLHAYAALRHGHRLWLADERAQKHEAAVREKYRIDQAGTLMTHGTMFEEIQAEVLNGLDGVVADLIATLQAPAEAKESKRATAEQKLTALYRCLRIGRHGRDTTVSRAEAKEIAWLAVAMMRIELSRMERSGELVPKEVLRRRVATALGISEGQVKHAWLASCREDPWDARIESNIRRRLVAKVRDRVAPKATEPKRRKGQWFKTTKLSKRTG